MKLASTFSILLLTCVTATCIAAAGMPTSQPDDDTLDQKFPGLTAGCLSLARLERLPAGVLLRSSELTVTEKDLADEIAKAPAAFRDQIRQNALLVLQHMAQERLLLAAARRDAGPGKAPATQSEQASLDAWIRPVVEKVKVDPREVDKFYADNQAMLGDTELKDVRAEIERYLLGRRQAQAAREHIRTIGRRMTISLSADWVARQNELCRDNPLDRLRGNGRPTLVDFGAAACCGPDKMIPVLDAVGEQFKDKLNVLFVNVREHPFLADRFGIEDIPAQILFDKAGRELFRNEGFIGEGDLARRVRESGIK